MLKEYHNMAKVFSIHEFELKPGASADALDQLIASNQSPTLPGWKTYFVKGERGERVNQYAMIHEFDSAEIRDQYFPSAGGEPSAEVQQLFGSPEMMTLGE